MKDGAYEIVAVLRKCRVCGEHKELRFFNGNGVAPGGHAVRVCKACARTSPLPGLTHPGEIAKARGIVVLEPLTASERWSIA